MNKVITQEEINSLDWFHQYEFPGGLKTKTSYRKHDQFRKAYEQFVIAQLCKIDFKDKSVIDIGCWDGFYSFLAKTRGAKSVLAADDYTQNWGAKRCFEIARELQGLDVDLMPDGNVYTIADKLDGKTFDVVLLLGVFYHLHAPYLALANVRRLCHENTVVILEGTCFKDSVRPQAKILLSDSAKSKFLPTSKLLTDMLRSCYMETVSESFISDFSTKDLLRCLPPAEVLEFLSKTTQGKMPHLNDTNELSAQANEGAEPSQESPGQSPLEPVDRIVMVAKPFAGKNDFHFYRPPFGLDRFDRPGRFDRNP